ncbi:Hypothetical protein PENO1_009170 [Penicillium occitanis (nom. inval.)]|nr:Hypothetical protein PENO1_009170 [Penicillium occitanis (nom. inval.)]PCH09884.1 hypothetical protein PENOC_006380 [Penicillium occitanis (nom. inval.)]
MSDHIITEALWIQMDNNRVRSSSGHYFLPPGSLPLIFTDHAIAQAVDELQCEPDEKIGLAQHIGEKATVTFAILVWMKVEKLIVNFRNHGVVDASLPLDPDRARRISTPFGETFAREFQWQFIPYVFPKDMASHHKEFQSQIILPFVDEPKELAVGGFSYVTETNIHPAMQNFYAQKGKVRVIKKRLQRVGSEEAGEFRWLTTFISALHGLASALCAVHNVRLNVPENGIRFEGVGYHHDLRPANILVSRNTFVLADFGLGKLKPANEPSVTTWKAGTGDYLAPECTDEDFHHQDVGRSVDIWAFGCLMAEVVTFAQRGKAGLEEFRKMRLDESPDKVWRNTYFFGSDKNYRPSVQRWLQSLETDAHSHSFSQVILTALTGHPVRRTQMTQIRERLALFSLVARLNAVYDFLTKIFEFNDLKEERSPSIMSIWFERERVRAFSKAFGLNSVYDNTAPTIEETVYDYCFNKLTDMFHITREFCEAHDADTESTGNLMRREVTSASQSTSTETLSTYTLSRDISERVQELWDILPDSRRRLVEAEWLHRILESDNIQELTTVQSSLSNSGHTPVYERGSALAMMKKIRLEMLSNPSTGQYDNQLSAQDIEYTDTFSGHQIGLFRKSTPVLVEWMYYSPRWESVSATQRALVMSLKAKGFGLTGKVEGLRVLDCLGFFEETKNNAGYGFVYKMPPQIHHHAVTSRPTTLHELLITSAKNAKIDKYSSEPLLEDKFVLAYKLVAFLADFHTIGWVHENFHSINVVFFLAPEEMKSIGPISSFILREPYIIGLHKSRPASEHWQTEGPAMDRRFMDYLRPEYLQHKRFSILDDYYSLGLMLLEIGLWYPEQGWSQQKEYKALPPGKLRELFLKRYVPRLGPRMGSIYRDIVEMCLNNGLDDKSPTVKTSEEKSQSIFRAFIHNVVYQLSELVRSAAPSKLGLLDSKNMASSSIFD